MRKKKIIIFILFIIAMSIMRALLNLPEFPFYKDILLMLMYGIYGILLWNFFLVKDKR